MDGMHVDPLQSVVAENGTHLTALKLRPTHPARRDGNAEPRRHTCHDTVSRGDLHPAFHRHRAERAGAREGPTRATRHPRPDDAIMPRQVSERLRNAASRE